MTLDNRAPIGGAPGTRLYGPYPQSFEIMMTPSALASLEADCEKALDGWMHTAGELSVLQDHCEDLTAEIAAVRAENAVLRRAVSAAYEMLRALRGPVRFFDVRHEAAYSGLKQIVEKNLMTEPES